MSSSLHNHDEYSVLDGYSHPKEYLKRAEEIGLKAFAITNHGNEYSFIYYDEIKAEFPDVKMIYGVELYECFNMSIKDPENKYFHLLALAKNERGRIALNEIITKSNFEGFYYKPRIDIESMKPYANDLIISSACLGSKLAKEYDYDKCIELVREYKLIFPHFFLEMQSHSSEDQVCYNKKILQLAKDTNTEFIITTDSHVATKKDLFYQAKHVQIAQDSDTASELYEGCYMQTDEEIHQIMDKQIGKENVNIGLRNTDKIADMIDVVNMPFQEPQLPHFPLPDGFKDNYEYIKYLLEIGWRNRKQDRFSVEEQLERKTRLEYELGIIHQMDYEGYFLIVQDFVGWAKDNGIATGAGRGSGAGSLVCFLLGITDIDPIKYGLIFERFLNPERISMPDIDSDFGDRDLVIAYLTNKYGIDRVCQVINFGYITPIVAIKDVGRVLDIPYQITDIISKRFVYETFSECMDNNPNIINEFPQYEKQEKLVELFDIANHISGRVRQAGIHAGGLGIVDTKITDYMALKVGSKGEHVIQVNKKKIENIGIIKFDILGVETLNILQEAVKDAGITLDDININNPKFEYDKKAFELLCEVKTNGIFQLGSQGMKDLVLRLQPKDVEELSALISLYRPDTMAIIEHYIGNKYGTSVAEYVHEDMKLILGKTYGCMVYQEQLLDIVRQFGGRTYGGADKFRKAIGGKNKKVVLEESDKLYKEIQDNGYDEFVAKTISDDMREKGGYLFNKSHAVSYAVLCLQTAYLKAHYPVEFMKALLNSKKDDNGELNKYIVDAQDIGVKVLPPNINHSENGFKIHNGSILFGLSAIKGIGEKFVEEVIEERNKALFSGFDDFYNRVNPSDAQVITLVKSGTIPTKDKRNFLINYAKKQCSMSEYKEVSTLPTLKELKETWDIDGTIIKDKVERLRLYNMKRRVKHKLDSKKKFAKHMDDFCEKYLQDEEMWEFQALSIFITDNPFREIYEYITPAEEILEGGEGVAVGVISNVTKKKDRNKNQFAFFHLYSAFGLMEITCWASQFSKYSEILKKGNRIVVLFNKKEDKFYVKEIKTYNQWLIDIKKTNLMKGRRKS